MTIQKVVHDIPGISVLVIGYVCGKKNSRLEEVVKAVFDKRVESLDSFSFFPYQTMKELSSRKNWVDYICAATELCNNKITRPSKLPTSCCHTVYVALVIFLGPDRAKEILSELRDEKNYKINYPDFDMRRNYGTSFEIVGLLKASEVRKFQQYINTIQVQDSGDSSVKIMDFFQKITYDFNTKDITSLVEEINHYEGRATPTQSVLIVVAAFCSDSLHHMFIIENFFSEGSFYRFYQSWSAIATLSQDFAKRHYANGSEGCWNVQGLKAFFEKFKVFYSFENMKKMPSQQSTAEDCFGYERALPPNQPFRISQREINGQATYAVQGVKVRYDFSCFNPKDSCNYRAVLERAVSR